MNKRNNQFYKKYDISLLDSNRRVRVIKSITNYFVDPADKNVCDTITDTEEERLITLSIPESNLHRLIDLETLFYNNIDDIGRRRMFEIWYEQQMIEKEIRHQFPSVQAAYEAYSLMLSLCNPIPNKFKDL